MNSTSKKSSILEAKIVVAIENFLDSRPASFTTKIHGGPFQHQGLPDIYHIENGITFWFEVKRPGENPTRIQTATMSLLNKAGAYCFVVRSVEDVAWAIDGILKNRDLVDELRK